MFFKFCHAFIQQIYIVGVNYDLGTVLMFVCVCKYVVYVDPSAKEIVKLGRCGMIKATPFKYLTKKKTKKQKKVTVSQHHIGFLQRSKQMQSTKKD